ncbi:hypothetical protein H6758_01605 [Candidatus Nomurabacteria bacterium]|nr:hypothetical protein [Candidatus Nomurabacteria bacterium]
MLDEALIKTFKNIGFDEKEAHVFVSLLMLGRVSVSEIADKAGIKRSITYHVLGRLQNQGYVKAFTDKKILEYEAVSPEYVFQNVQTAVKDFKFMIPFMRSLQKKSGDTPRVEFFEGIDAMIKVYRMYETKSNIRYVTSTKRLYQIIPNEVDAWVQRYKRKQTKTQALHLLENTPEDKRWGKQVACTGQEVRFLPKGTCMEMDFAIGEDILGISSFDPVYVVVVYSESIARSAATLFDLAWKSLEE